MYFGTVRASSALANRHAEELGVAEPRAALLAVDREGRRERRRARRAAGEHLAAAALALARDLRLELLDPAPRPATAQAHGGPVAQHLAALLAQPVCGLSHGGGR